MIQASTSSGRYRTSAPILRYLGPRLWLRHFLSVRTLIEQESATSCSFRSRCCVLSFISSLAAGCFPQPLHRACPRQVFLDTNLRGSNQEENWKLNDERRASGLAAIPPEGVDHWSNPYSWPSPRNSTCASFRCFENYGRFGLSYRIDCRTAYP